MNFNFKGKDLIALLYIGNTTSIGSSVSISIKSTPWLKNKFHLYIEPAPLPILLNMGFLVTLFHLHRLKKSLVLVFLFWIRLNCLDNFLLKFSILLGRIRPLLMVFIPKLPKIKVLLFNKFFFGHLCYFIQLTIILTKKHRIECTHNHNYN